MSFETELKCLLDKYNATIYSTSGNGHECSSVEFAYVEDGVRGICYTTVMDKSSEEKRQVEVF